jgi:hypothetical protein
MAAEKVAAGSIQSTHSLSAGGTVHNTRADEIGPFAAEPAGHALDPDPLINVVPFSPDLNAIEKVQAVRFGPNRDCGSRFTIAAPVPSAGFVGLQPARLAQLIHVNRAVVLHCCALRAPRRPDPNPPMPSALFYEINPKNAAVSKL